MTAYDKKKVKRRFLVPHNLVRFQYCSRVIFLLQQIFGSFNLPAIFTSNIPTEVNNGVIDCRNDTFDIAIIIIIIIRLFINNNTIYSVH